MTISILTSRGPCSSQLLRCQAKGQDRQGSIFFSACYAVPDFAQLELASFCLKLEAFIKSVTTSADISSC